MSKYAQLITSFEREGNFPLEANYVFPTVEDLKQFYTDELAKATLHKGLLKVVENNGKDRQALYWVTKKQTTDELEFTELVSGTSVSDLDKGVTDLLAQLEQEIADRKQGDRLLWGIDNPESIEEEYNSLNDLVSRLKELKQTIETFNTEVLTGDGSLKNIIKGLVGTTSEDILGYLDTLPYSTITEIVEALDRLLNPEHADEDVTDAIDTMPEVTGFLEGYTNKDTLKAVLEKLWRYIEGDILPSDNFRTLRDIEDWVIEHSTIGDTRYRQTVEELNNIETAVGLNADGSYTPEPETYYLGDSTSVMGALQILDHLLHTYVSANTPSVRNSDPAIKLEVTQEMDSYVISAGLKLSSQAGNQLKKNSDGLYTNVRLYYSQGQLSLMANDNVVSSYYIGAYSIVDSAYYDEHNEKLVFVFKLDNGSKDTVEVPVSALIQEWQTDNPEDSPIELVKTEHIDGPDKLKALLRLAADHDNIASIKGNALYVAGNTEAIQHNGGSLKDYLDSQDTEVQGNADTLSELKKQADKTQEDLEALTQTVTDNKTAADAALQSADEKADGIQEALTQETTERKDADTGLKEEIAAEKERAEVKEAELQATLGKLERAADWSMAKELEPNPGCLATYTLTRDGVAVGDEIEIPEPEVTQESLNSELERILQEAKTYTDNRLVWIEVE